MSEYNDPQHAPAPPDDGPDPILEEARCTVKDWLIQTWLTLVAVDAYGELPRRRKAAYRPIVFTALWCFEHTFRRALHSNLFAAVEAVADDLVPPARAEPVRVGPLRVATYTDAVLGIALALSKRVGTATGYKDFLEQMKALGQELPADAMATGRGPAPAAPDPSAGLDPQHFYAQFGWLTDYDNHLGDMAQIEVLGCHDLPLRRHLDGPFAQAAIAAVDRWSKRCWPTLAQFDPQGVYAGLELEFVHAARLRSPPAQQERPAITEGPNGRHAAGGGSRARNRPAKDKHELWERWHSQDGLSYQQCADRHKDQSREEVTADAIAKALKRLRQRPKDAPGQP
jgi:hypothetical protein